MILHVLHVLHGGDWSCQEPAAACAEETIMRSPARPVAIHAVSPAGATANSVATVDGGPACPAREELYL